MCDMVSKIYLAVLGISVAVMAFFTYYAWSWLQSIGKPAAAIDGYLYHAALGWVTLVASWLILMLIANVILWATQRAWAMWTTFVFAAIFLIAKFFWLGTAFLNFARENSMTDIRYSFAPLTGVILIVAVGIVTLANQFLSVRLQQKMYAPSTPESPAEEPELEPKEPE